ncbi:hypothetical protein JI664_23330 [Rhodobacter sp. NTK016B]|uniref:hypothetical protein n=1 Tax=Rhodobacter sp. NTK016B TaxID=2759676 RepID=UPI001A905859|nr:hypothetical protein [Rhodobacter sp. NTK016B]MBN8294923.1 hypothetical protein [Rhodobacter sp. NTK016B]
MIGAIFGRFTWPYAALGALLIGGALFVAGQGYSQRMYDQGHAAGWGDAQAALNQITEETRGRIDNAETSTGDTGADLDFLLRHLDRLSGQ